MSNSDTSSSEKQSDNEQPSRKASDVLLELEEKVDRIVQITALYDHNIKLILSKANAAHTLLQQVATKLGLEEHQQLNALKNSNAISIPAGVPIEVATENKGQRRTTRPTVSEQPPTVFPEHQAQPTEQMKKSATTPPERKIPVVQRIQRNNKDVFMADIKIFAGNEQIFKGRSNATGKYQCLLAPGKYTVKVSKTDPTTKQLIEQGQEITITSSEGTLTLPNFVLKN